jgi:hypothetical protein
MGGIRKFECAESVEFIEERCNFYILYYTILGMILYYFLPDCFVLRNDGAYLSSLRTPTS